MKLKFTIQHMLWATLAFGLIAIAISAAYRGNIIAQGLLIAPFVMVITFAVLAAIYWPCYWASRTLYPPIHTPAPADFSKTQSSFGYENNTTDSPDTKTNSPDDNAPATGAPE